MLYLEWRIYLRYAFGALLAETNDISKHQPFNVSLHPYLAWLLLLFC